MEFFDNWLFRGGFGLIGSLVWALYLFPLAYLVLRWRAYRERQTPDPQLGIKVVLYYFRFLTLQLVLAGLTAAVAGTLLGGGRGPLFRVAGALIVGGGSLYAGCVAAIHQRTNAARFPDVGRLFTGAGALVAGLVGIAAWVGFFLALFSGGYTAEAIKITGSLLLVYLPAFAVLGLSLLRIPQNALLPPAGAPGADPQQPK